MTNIVVKEITNNFEESKISELNGPYGVDIPLNKQCRIFVSNSLGRTNILIKWLKIFLHTCFKKTCFPNKK